MSILVGLRNKSVGDVLTKWLPKMSPGGTEDSLTALFQHLGGAKLDYASFRKVLQLKGQTRPTQSTCYI